MKTEDVMRCVDAAMSKANLKTKAPPKILSDNGACYISKDLKVFLSENIASPSFIGHQPILKLKGRSSGITDRSNR